MTDQPRKHKLILDGGVWIEDDEADPWVECRVTLVVNEGQLGEAVAAALKRHDRTKTYAGGAFTVQVERIKP